MSVMTNSFKDINTSVEDKIITNDLLYNELDTDYKIEVITLNLLNFYKEVHHLFLKRLGGDERSYHKDIKSISLSFLGLDGDVLNIETYQEGIYDYLPNGVFHTPTLGDFSSGVDTIIEGIRNQRRIEASARKLFQPFENEAFYLQLSMLMQENNYDISSEGSLLVDVLSDLFPLLKAIERKTARIFVFLLPFFHAIRGNKKWFEKCLKAFLQIPVRIDFLPNRLENIGAVSSSLVLSQMRLGQSSLLSGSHLDGERNWGIYYGVIPYESLNHYMLGAPLRQLLQVLYDYCLPVQASVEEFFITERKQDSFTLALEGNLNRLGYSTFL